MIMLSLLVAVEIILVAFAAVIVKSGAVNKLSKSFLLLLASFGIWMASNYFSNIISLPHNELLFVNRALFSSSIILLLAVLYFVEMATVRVGQRRFLKVLYMSGIVASTLSFFNLVVEDVYIEDQVAAIHFGALTVFYFGVVALIAIVIFARLIASSMSKDKRTRSYSHTLLLSVGLSIFFTMITNVVIPVVFHNFTFAQPGAFFGLLIVAGVGYSVVRHQLFDIKLAVVRSIVYAGVLLTLSAVYYLFAYVFSILAFGGKSPGSASVSLVDIFLALVLAFLFQPIKHFFDRITNNIFYRDKYKSEEFFADLSQLLASTTDLRGLLERAAAEIGTTLKAEQAFFFLYYTNATHHHISAGTKGHAKLPLYDARMLDTYVLKHEGIILTENLYDYDELRRMLVSHRIALVMPLRHVEGVIGYVCLGEQQGRGYAKHDLKVLMTIADELVIAIQNALSLHEIKEINATLQQRIDNATKELRSSNAQLRHLDEVKDEFMSMASHQLRTPLTSVKGYLSMVIEGDTGEISPQQRRVLEEAFNSSERMVRLIADFLNVSRLQTGKFVIEKAPSDIVKVVKEEVSSLKVIAKTHDMKLVFQIPKESLPEVQIDEAKIRQVIMNFIDNAIYYSRPNTSVKVVLEQIDNDITFKVIDTGIGVPEDEQPKLFNKFFRAKNARKQRPDGTGVGLYLAKKVITAHRGKMIFASEEGKGSTFGFRIPIDQQ